MNRKFSSDINVNNQMEKLKGTISYLLSISLTWFLLYTGVYLKMTGFMNILSFWIWFMFISTFLIILSKDAIIAYYSVYRTRNRNRFVEGLFDVIIIAVLVYYGNFFLGTLFTLATIFDLVIKKKGEELAHQVPTVPT